MDAAILLSANGTQVPTISATIPQVNDSAFDIDFTFLGAENATASDGASTGGVATLTSAGSSWTVNQFAGGKVRILAGNNAGDYDVVSNTATVLTLATAPANTTTNQKFHLADSRTGRFGPCVRRIFCGGAGNVKLKMIEEGASTATWRTYAVQAGSYLTGAFVKMAAAVASTGTTATGLIAEQ